MACSYNKSARVIKNKSELIKAVPEIKEQKGPSLVVIKIEKKNEIGFEKTRKISKRT